MCNLIRLVAVIYSYDLEAVNEYLFVKIFFLFTLLALFIHPFTQKSTTSLTKRHITFVENDFCRTMVKSCTFLKLNIEITLNNKYSHGLTFIGYCII